MGVSMLTRTDYIVNLLGLAVDGIMFMQPILLDVQCIVEPEGGVIQICTGMIYREGAKLLPIPVCLNDSKI